ncbi:unnamed protein product, partial [Polarella glacialis]
ALSDFLSELGRWLPGRDRRLSRGTADRARRLRPMLLARCRDVLARLLREGLLDISDLHGIWQGFVQAGSWEQPQ